MTLLNHTIRHKPRPNGAAWRQLTSAARSKAAASVDLAQHAAATPALIQPRRHTDQHTRPSARTIYWPFSCGAATAAVDGRVCLCRMTKGHFLGWSLLLLFPRGVEKSFGGKQRCFSRLHSRNHAALHTNKQPTNQTHSTDKPKQQPPQAISKSKRNKKA